LFAGPFDFDMEFGELNFSVRFDTTLRVTAAVYDMLTKVGRDSFGGRWGRQDMAGICLARIEVNSERLRGKAYYRRAGAKATGAMQAKVGEHFLDPESASERRYQCKSSKHCIAASSAVSAIAYWPSVVAMPPVALRLPKHAMYLRPSTESSIDAVTIPKASSSSNVM
jgi:hypothetical protein